MYKENHWNETYLNADGSWDNGSQQAEEIFFDKLAIRIREAVFQYNAANKAPMRANHAKLLAGFTKAVFHVRTDLPADLAYGFLKPGASYATVVRFSNAAGKSNPDDAVPDLRGIALRLRTPGQDYDLLMTSAEVHHAKNATEAMVAINAGAESERFSKAIPPQCPGREMILGAPTLDYMVEHAGPESGARMASTLKAEMALKVYSVSTESFWSRAAFAIGPDTKPENSTAIKFRLRPAIQKPVQEAIVAENDLGRKLTEELQAGDIAFFFEVQRYANPLDTPIEDNTRAWTTPFETVAELVIPRGSISEHDAVDQLAFSPWNVDTRFFLPLGSMNRARRKVYAASWHERTHESAQADTNV
jgi:catalase